MSFKNFTIDEKRLAIERAVVVLKKHGYRKTDPDFYRAFTSVLADLATRAEYPRCNTLGQLDRALTTLVTFRNREEKDLGGYDKGQLIALAMLVISKWPTISQALEQFGEESAE